MNYFDGNTVRLGDVVSLTLHDGAHEARVVMIGDTLEHSSLDQSFVDWIAEQKNSSSRWIAIQWTGINPLGHSDPSYAPVSDILTTDLADDIFLLRRRGEAEQDAAANP